MSPLPRKPFGNLLADRLAHAESALGFDSTTGVGKNRGRLYGIPIGKELTSGQLGFFNSNRSFARKVASGYVNRRYGGAQNLGYYGVELKDIEQLAEIALVESIMSFAPKKNGNNFHAWSTSVIQHSIADWMRQYGWGALRIPRSSTAKKEHLRDLQEQMYDALHRMPTTEELAARAKLPPHKVEKLLNSSKTVSLDEILELSAERVVSPEKFGEFMTLLEKSVDNLRITPQARQKALHALDLRAKGYDLKAIGARMGVSESRVAQILNLFIQAVERSPELKTQLEDIVDHPIVRSTRRL